MGRPLSWSMVQWDAYNAWVDAFPKFMVIAHPSRKLNTHDRHTLR
jgi:hypothetical protein